MISTAFSLTTVFLLAVTASVQDAAEIQPDVFVRFVEGDASAFALMAEWSTTYKKWELLQRDVNTKYTKTTDLTPCMLTCQRDDAKKEMQCTDSYRQTSIDLQQKALTAGAVTPLVCTTTETQTTGSLGLECQASSTDNFLRIVVNMVKETALPSVQCSPKAIAAGVEITCSTTDSTISKLSYFFLGITGQKIDGTSIIIPWDTFQPGTNPILILVTLGNGDLHYFSITVDADLIYTVCDVQISFLDADQRNMRFGIQASLQKNISIDGGTYYVHNTLGIFAGHLLSVPTALLKDGKNTIMISVSVTCGDFPVTLQKEAYLTVLQPHKLTDLILGPTLGPIEGDSFLVTISVRGDGIDFLMMVKATGAQTITRWSCTLGGEVKPQPDSSPIRFNRGALEEGRNVILVVVTGSDGDTVTRNFIIYYLKHIPSTQTCGAECGKTQLSSGIKVVCSTSSGSIQSVQYSINDDGNQVKDQMSTFVITDEVAWRKGSNMLQLIVVCDNGVQAKQPAYEIILTPPDLQCQVIYSPCVIENEVTISCKSTTTAKSTKSCKLDGNPYTKQCGLIKVLEYETLTLGRHTFTVDMTDVFGLKAKSEVAFSVKFEIWCTGACNFDTKLVSVSCESTYPASSWTVSINGGTAKDRSQNFDLDLKDEDLTQDLTLKMTAINTSGESATDIIFFEGTTSSLEKRQ